VSLKASQEIILIAGASHGASSEAAQVSEAGKAHRTHGEPPRHVRRLTGKSSAVGWALV